MGGVILGLVGEKGLKDPIPFFISDVCVYIWRIYNSMKHVKLFEAFRTQSLSEEQIEWLNGCTRGSWKLNPSTGLIDVDVDFGDFGDFNCAQQNLTDFKGVAFGHVKGSFRCGNNQLTSLEGAPQTVGGGFYCNGNQLTSLEGAPQTVGGYFICTDNQLTSLEGAPQTVGGSFDCQGNQLTSLGGAPQTVNGSFDCNNNPVSEETLSSIFALMQKGKSYQQALEEYWSNMDNDDMALMYKDHSSLTPEESRKYKALATVNRIKNYL